MTGSEQPDHQRSEPRRQAVPPVVYLPVVVDEDGEIADIRMIRLGDGRVALCAYTALDRFIACWGEHQPWMLVQTAHIGQINETKPFEVKMLDVLVPEPIRSGHPPTGNDR